MDDSEVFAAWALAPLAITPSDVLLGAIALEHLLALAESPPMVSLRIVRALLHPFAESTEAKFAAVAIEPRHTLRKA
jgi:hypothetical protein